MSYRLIESGKISRQEYYGNNRSPLFQSLPKKDLTEGRRKSYENFFQNSLPKLLEFYFPTHSEDYNNRVDLKILEYQIKEPLIREREAYIKKVSWVRGLFLTWLIKWECKRVQFQPINEEESLEESLKHWIEQSFKVGKFTLIHVKEKNQWLVEADNLTIALEVFPSEIKGRWSVKFNYEQKKEVSFCRLPKMNKQGNFIINGHDKVIVFQSVRAPNAYFFQDTLTQLPYGEIIPSKGPWIRFFLDDLSAKAKEEARIGIKVKFLNTGSVFDLNQILTETSFTQEIISDLLGDEEVIKNSLKLGKSEAKAKNEKQMSKFLFNENNSYFLLGYLGRKKFNRKMNIFYRIKGQTLAEDLKDKQGKLIFSSGTVIEEEQIEILKHLISGDKLITRKADNHEFYLIKIFSPQNPDKKIHLLALAKPNEQKNYFDGEDLLVFLSYFLNLQNGVGQVSTEKEKDNLGNQIMRSVGDLLYNIFDNKFGVFKKAIESRHIPAISQLKKSDPTKFPKIQEFNKEIERFFHSSSLAQPENQTNPLAKISHAGKITSSGLGGHKGTNIPLSTRDNNDSHPGRVDLVETPEGQKVGIIRHSTLNSEFNEHGQILAPYYVVKAGKVTNELVYLASEEEQEFYVTHCSIKINKDNLIEEEKVWAKYQNNFVLVPKEKINFIYSSFYHLNSITSATIPFFQHNDSARMLMASNMQKQAVTLLKGEAPLVASGVESFLFNHDSLTIKAEKAGKVDYVDSEKIIIDKQEYPLTQFAVSNTNSLVTSKPLIKKGEKVAKGQAIAAGSYNDQQELSLGCNVRVAFMCGSYNFEDAIIVSKSLIKKDVLTSFFAKEYTVIRKRIKIDKKPREERFHPQPEIAHLDSEGIVKIGTVVQENDLLVSKQTPYKKQDPEELLSASILGEKSYSFADSSFRLPWGEKEGTVYAINRWQGKEVYQRGNTNYSADDLEVLKICVVQKRKLEEGDKLTTRFGNKGVVGKIVPEIDMPFDKDGNPMHIIFNPLSVPSRMNIGQLIEALLGLVAHKSNSKLLVRPFNTPSWEKISQIAQEKGVEDYGLTQLYDGCTGLPFDQKVLTGYIYVIKLNHMVVDKFHARNTGPYALVHQQPVKGRAQGGGQRFGEMEGWAFLAYQAAYALQEMHGAKSEDIFLRNLLQNALLFGEGEVDLKSNNSESFNLLLQYFRAIGFDLTANDYQGKILDFYKQFSKTSEI